MTKAPSAVQFSNDTERLQHINAIRKSPVSLQLKCVIDLLSETRQALTPEEINEACCVDINGNKALFDSLRNNHKVTYDGNHFSYKASEVSKISKKRGVGAASKGYVKWTEAMDDVFIDALLQQQSIGNRPDGIFTTTAYNNIVKEISEKLHFSFEKDHLKNRIKTYKTNFNACYDLFKGLSGFSWSPITKMWDADPEVWSALIESKPEAKKWMTTPIQHYDKLFELFAKDRATGAASESAKEKTRRWAHEQSMGIDTIEDVDQMVFDNEVTVEHLGFDLSSNEPVVPSEVRSDPPSHHPASQSTCSGRGKKRKLEIADIFEKQIEVLERGIEMLASAIREGNVAIREGNVIAERGRAHVYSENEVYDALLEIDVDETLRLDAYVFLIENVGRVRAFFGCPPKDRKQLLARMMRSSR